MSAISCNKLGRQFMFSVGWHIALKSQTQQTRCECFILDINLPPVTFTVDFPEAN